MKALWIFFLMPSLVMAQIDPPTDDPDDHFDFPKPPLNAQAMNLPEDPSCTANYRATVPTTGVDILIENPNDREVFLLVARLDGAGYSQIRSLRLAALGQRVVSADLFNPDDQIYLFSLETFNVRTSEPIDLYGIWTNEVPVIPPAVPVSMHQVIMPTGKSYAVCVDAGNNVHFPAHGHVIGYRNGTMVFLTNGATLNLE